MYLPSAPILSPVYTNGWVIWIHQLCLLHKKPHKFTNIKVNNDMERDVVNT